jgi:hypothetical protein
MHEHFAKYNKNDKFQEDGMGKPCSTYESEQEFIRFGGKARSKQLRQILEK